MPSHHHQSQPRRSDHNDLARHQDHNRRAYNANHNNSETELDPDHPNSSLWPEVFSNGRENFSKSFYRQFPWARGFDPFEELPFEQTIQSTRSEQYFMASRKGLPLDKKAKAPPVLAFVKDLISLELDDLPDDEHNCPICREKYREGEREEMPLVLPCEHVVGNDCLVKWLSNFSGMNDKLAHDNCPICRAKLVKEVKMPLDTDEGLKQLLRDANYFLTAQGPLTLTKQWRRRWENIKHYVNNYLSEKKLFREKKELRHRLFMKYMRFEINQKVWYAHISGEVRQPSSASKIREQMHKKLDNLERKKFMGPYLDSQSGGNPDDSDPEETMDFIEKTFKEMSSGLRQMIQSTYAKCASGISIGCSGHQSRPNNTTHTAPNSKTPLDAEYKKLRHQDIVVKVQVEIQWGSLRTYIALPREREQAVRIALMRAFIDSLQRGELLHWLQRADGGRLGQEKKYSSKGEDVPQLLECIIDRIYRHELR